MGIYDRDYARRDPRSGSRLTAVRSFSVTTWIIIVCSVVFVAGVFLPQRTALVRTELLPGVDARQIEGFKASDFKVQSIRWLPGARDVNLRVGEARVDFGMVPVATQWYHRQPLLASIGYFSTSKALLYDDPIYGWSGMQVWRFITFQFLHANFNHIVFNMIALFFFGGMVEHYLGRKRFLAFYLLCGVCGALLYLVLNGLAVAWQAMFGTAFMVPGLLFNDPTAPLVGASAGVFGVIMAGAFLAPNARVLLFFIIPMRLRTLAYGLLAFALLAVWFQWSNAGGEAAHIGGALAGYYFIRNPHHLHGMFDFMGRFDPTSRVARARVAARKGNSNAEIDRILAKIRSAGLHSLTDAEKQALREASRR